MGAGKLMRFIAFILMIAGLGAAFGYPYYFANYANFEIGKYTVYDKTKGFTQPVISLSEKDSPIDIQFVAAADTVEVKGGSDVAIKISVLDSENQNLINETIRFSGPMGDTSKADTSSIEMNVGLKRVRVKNTSLYTFDFAETDVQEIPLSAVTMTVIGNVAAMNEQMPTIGFALLGFGALLFIFGRRGARPNVGNAPMGQGSKASRIGRSVDVAPPKAVAPEKPKSNQKWGRGE
ncbi:MAG: hypothetical protein U5K75_04425 [Ahrensia sp.]|nr:hypothetical protein [Ahrensia sp.]